VDVSDCPVTVVSEPLYFISNKIHNHPAGVLKETILTFYREDEILSAKATLLNFVNATAAVQPYVKKRIGDNKLKATVDDIFHIWSAMDETDAIAQLPTFCSSNSSRVPVVEDELSDLSFIRQTIATLSNRLSDLSDTVSRMHDAQVAQSDQFKSHLDNLTGSVDRFVQAHQRAQGETVSGISTEYRAANHDLHGTPVPTVPGDDRKNGQDTDNSGHDNSIMGAASAEWPPLPAPSQSLTFTSCSSRKTAQAGQSASQEHSKDQDEVFVSVTNRKKNKENKRKAIVGGKLDDRATFKGVVKKVVFCVSRLEPGTSTKVVTDYLASQGINALSCYALEPKDDNSSNDPPSTRGRPSLVSMRITVASGAVAKFMSPDLWPEGVSVRKWTFKPREGVAAASQRQDKL